MLEQLKLQKIQCEEKIREITAKYEAEIEEKVALYKAELVEEIYGKDVMIGKIKNLIDSLDAAIRCQEELLGIVPEPVHESPIEEVKDPVQMCMDGIQEEVEVHNEEAPIIHEQNI